MVHAGKKPPLVKQEQIFECSQSPNQERDTLLCYISRAEEITADPDTASLVQRMMEFFSEITLANSAHYFQIDQPADELVITHISGETETNNLIGLRLKRKGLTGISLCDTKILVIGDLPQELDWLHTVDPQNAARKKYVINIPVIYKEHSLGVMQVFNYNQADLDLLVVLRDRFAVELYQRSEIEKLRRANQRLLTLVDMLGDVAGTLDRNQLLRQVTENAAELVDAERSSLYLVNPATNETLYQVAYQRPKSDPSSTAQPSGSPSRKNQRSGVRRGMNGTKNPQDDTSYFNRLAITVPLQGESLVKGLPEERTQVLGGLMVSNKLHSAFQEEDVQLMRILSNQASIFLQVAELYESSEELFLGVIKSLAAAIDAKDPYTQGHSLRVSDYAVRMAEEMGLDDTLINDIRIGSLLHDVGKIGMPDAILLKNGVLNANEIEIMRQHPRTGGNILSQVKLLDPMLPAILEHHERLDGSGYPARKKGDNISLMGRIVAVSDVFDAMTSTRPYRQALSVQAVMSYMYEKAEVLFDMHCVRALDEVLRQ